MPLGVSAFGTVSQLASAVSTAASASSTASASTARDADRSGQRRRTKSWCAWCVRVGTNGARWRCGGRSRIGRSVRWLCMHGVADDAPLKEWLRHGAFEPGRSLLDDPLARMGHRVIERERQRGVRERGYPYVRLLAVVRLLARSEVRERDRERGIDPYPLMWAAVMETAVEQRLLVPYIGTECNRAAVEAALERCGGPPAEAWPDRTAPARGGRRGCGTRDGYLPLFADEAARFGSKGLPSLFPLSALLACTA